MHASVRKIYKFEMWKKHLGLFDRIAANIYSDDGTKYKYYKEQFWLSKELLQTTSKDQLKF